MGRRWDFDEVPILVDWGRSGGSEKRRPGYQQLRTLIETGQVTDVFSYDLSRLTRSLEEWVKLANLCRERGVRIHLSKEGTFDFSTASGEMLANILASVAQAVRRWASERSRETVTALRARGHSIGRRPYGSRPGEDIEAVKAAYVETGSYNGAARRLNELGSLPTLKGKPWSHGSVSWIIRKQAPELTVRRPALAGPQKPARFALQKLVYCHCGGSLSPYEKRNGNDPHYTVYRCTRAGSIPTHPRPFSVPETVLLDWARREASRLRLPKHVEADLRAEQERGELDERRLRILDMYEAGHLTAEDRDRRLEPIYAKVAEIDAKAAMSTIVSVPEIDWSWPPERINTVLHALWERIETDETLRPVRAEWRVPEWRAD
jgi:DNA invertase Pin-like site-specific DNA recombinase